MILLAVVSFGVVLWPLAVDESSALFFAIPWDFRWLMIHAAILTAIAAGLVRLAIVRPGDAWPRAGRRWEFGRARADGCPGHSG